MPGGKFASWLVTAGILAAFPAALLAQPTEQLPRHKVATLCWPDLAQLERFNRVDPIPVGCELNTCCPGCPKPELLVWRILLKGGPIDSAVLEFDNLTGRGTAAFDLGGAARQEGTKIIIGKGESIVRGLPALPAPGERPAVGRLQLRYDTAWGANGNAKAAEEEMPVSADAADSVELMVEQLLGDVVVNEYLLRYNLRFCSSHESDKVVLRNAGDDPALLLIDARKAGPLFGECVEEMEQSGADTIAVSSLTKSRGCRSEISVFSKGHRMLLLAPFQPDWTSNDDTRFVDMLDPHVARVIVWLADPQAQSIAETHLARASEIYAIEKTGIRFTWKFAAVSPSDRTIVGKECTPRVNRTTTGALGVLGTLNSRPENPLFTKHALNVYYVANAGLTGENCFVDRNIQYVGQAASNETLAHELGHSMGLWHTDEYDGDQNEVLDFGRNNLMWPDTPSRCCMSEGQGFRLNAHCTSTLNVNGTRTGLVRNCPDIQPSNALCPAGSGTHCPGLNQGIDARATIGGAGP